MDKDNLKGKIDDIKGRMKRQAGEWTGDDKLQAEGVADQVKGKIQNAWGNVKEGARDMTDEVKDQAHDVKDGIKRRSGDENRDIERDIEHDDVERKRDVA